MWKKLTDTLKYYIYHRPSNDCGPECFAYGTGSFCKLNSNCNNVQVEAFPYHELSFIAQICNIGEKSVGTVFFG